MENSYPRDKTCGDKINKVSQKHLKEMGVWQEIEDKEMGRWASKIGIVSSSGKSCIGECSKSRVISIQRYILDQKISKAAKLVGATVIDDFEADYYNFDKNSKRWTVGNRLSKGKQVFNLHI